MTEADLNRQLYSRFDILHSYQRQDRYKLGWIWGGSWIELWSILGPSWGPSWGQVGNISAQDHNGFELFC